LQCLANELKIQDRVCFVGRRGRSQLKYYYSAADLFVTTPWYEPFGITPLEAMACGTPVVASRSTAIPEVVGDAGLLIDPLDVDDIRQGIERVLEDSALRAAMRQSGLARARLFSWETVAAKVNRVIQEVSY
jgi:glycosyltransferase involved in cell wall biosynthesis